MAGNDDPRLHPPDEEIASLSCRRVLVAVAGKDTLRDRGRLMAARMRAGDVTLVESDGEDHGFHLYSPLRATSKKLMETMVHFINQPPPTTTTVFPELDLHGCSAQPVMKLLNGPCRRKTLYGPTFAARVRRPSKAHVGLLPPTVSGSRAISFFF